MTPTPPAPFAPPRDWALRMKRALRMALDLAGVSQAELARLLGEYDDTVAAWCSDNRMNQVPMWILLHPRLPPAVREHLITAFAEAAGFAVAPLCAHTPEAQANVVAGGAGDVIVRVSAALRDQRIDPAEARDLLPSLRTLRAEVDGLERHCVDVISRGGDGR